MRGYCKLLLLLAQYEYKTQSEWISKAQLGHMTSATMNGEWTTQQLDDLKEQRWELDEDFYGPVF